MIKAQKTGYGDIENINLRKELDNQTFFHPRPTGQSDYGKFERYITFWLNDVNYHITECKASKWYKKQPHYRPTGKATYRLLITTWDENGQNPVYQNADFESLSQIEKQFKG